MPAEEVFLSAARSMPEQLVRLDSATSLFPGGRNGPYFDLESPVRNSAHALCTMAIAHRLTGEDSYATHGRALARFLLSEHEFLLGGSPVHRQRHPKDWCNGVIGPAWLMEGLTIGGRLLSIPEAVDKAHEIAERQPFDEAAALWRRQDPRKGAGGIDRTLNHQAYFASAAAAAGRPRSNSARDAVDAFLDHLANGGLRVDPSGLIVHHIAGRNEGPRTLGGEKERILRAARNSPVLLRIRHGTSDGEMDMHARDLGYHIYSLFSLANLRHAVPTHALWASALLRSALELVVSPGWLALLDGNRYAYPYNGPGLELPLIARAFGDIEPRLHATADDALAMQLLTTQDAETSLFSTSTDDRLTLSARVYELGLSLTPSL